MSRAYVEFEYPPTPLFYSYVISLIIALSYGSFWVLKDSGIFLGIGLLAMPIIITVLGFREMPVFVVAMIHFIIAILIHPALSIKDIQFYDAGEYFKMLKYFFSSGISASNQTGCALELSTGLRKLALLTRRIQSPVLFWLNPPSVIFFFWSIVWLLFGGKILRPCSDDEG